MADVRRGRRASVAAQSTDRGWRVPKGYVVLLLDVHDAAGYRTYLDAAIPTVTGHGGRFLFAGDQPDVREGPWPAERSIVIEFPSVAAARSWYESSDYGPLVADRRRTAGSLVAIFEGSEDSRA
jgi:uncharacterized protein (DUF1330 family)